MKSTLHELATKVGFEVVNAEDGYANYEYSQKLSDIQSIDYIIRVEDQPSGEQAKLTFSAIVNVLPKKLRKRIYKLVKHSDITSEDNSLELVLFAIDEFKSKCDYNHLKEYAQLLSVDLEKLGYNFSYILTKKEYRTILAKIEQALPMEYAPVLGKIKKIEYKIGYLKSNKVF